jgi:hypothetical protein
MKNQSNPDQTGQQENSKEMLNALLLFANALGLIIKPGQGIVIDVKGDVDLPNMKKVILYNSNDKIHITECKEELEEGTVVELEIDESLDKS